MRVLTAAAVLLAARLGAAELPATPELRLKLASPSCVIVAPQSEDADQAVARLRVALEKAAGAAPRVVEDGTEPSTLGDGPLILLGGVADNAVIRKLYFAAYDFTALSEKTR